MIRVGDLASAAGLTVRALHHYEEIGLLSPSARTAAGHRLYHPETVERLYRITRLRRLGLSLDQIGRALDDPNWNLAAALRHHLSSVDTQITALTALRAGVTAVLVDVDAATDPTNDLLELITTMSTLDSPLRRRIWTRVPVLQPIRRAFDLSVAEDTASENTPARFVDRVEPVELESNLCAGNVEHAARPNPHHYHRMSSVSKHEPVVHGKRYRVPVLQNAEPPDRVGTEQAKARSAIELDDGDGVVVHAGFSCGPPASTWPLDGRLSPGRSPTLRNDSTVSTPRTRRTASSTRSRASCEMMSP
jgi:DNA-binding transcriptional MerR regulator